MVSLFLRNFVFTILHPGLVAGLIPFWILGDKINRAIVWPSEFYQYLGIIIFTVGLIIMFACIISFAVKGRGTLSPIDPTKRLVVTGLYHFSRNPMYVGVMLILIGEAIFTHSNNLLSYLLIVFIAFNIFILLVEEPRLRKDFGEEYNQYCHSVRMWI